MNNVIPNSAQPQTGLPRVTASLFATCLGDMLFPQAVESVVRVLRRAGVRVDFPTGQTCCGQPAFNAGYPGVARRLARQTIRAFQHSEAVVIPSGSCAAMVRHYYPDLFADDPTLHAEAVSLGNRLFEFSEYIVRVLNRADVAAQAQFPAKVTYHTSCHMLRGLGVREEPLTLLTGVRGLDYVPLQRPQICCGFGGTFAVKMPNISGAMLDEKVADILGTGARAVVACDGACLMHIGGGLRRADASIIPLHLAEVLDRGISQHS